MSEHRVSPRTAVVVTTLVVVGSVHVLPGVALVLPDLLERLYGLDGPTAAEVVLLRHRALLLGLIGVLALLAVVQPRLRQAALLTALVSNVVYIGLVVATPTSAEITRVALVDAVLLPFVVLALVVDGRVARPVPVDQAGGVR